MNTAELLDRLQRHYIKPGQGLPGGIFLREVGWNGGGLGFGGCDAIYVGFTSTSGRILVGHELKVSRADWLTELNKPGKADGWADQCHQWWLVVSDPAIVHDGELPAGWGLMSPGASKTRMQVHVGVRAKENHTPAWTAVRSVMARQDTLRAQAISDAHNDADRRAYTKLEERVEEQLARRLKKAPDIDEVRRRLKLLEDALGIDVNYPDGDRYGGVKLEDLATLAQAAKAYGSVQLAVKQLQRNYEVRSLQRSLDALATAITDFGTQTAEVEPFNPWPDTDHSGMM